MEKMVDRICRLNILILVVVVVFVIISSSIVSGFVPIRTSRKNVRVNGLVIRSLAREDNDLSDDIFSEQQSSTQSLHQLSRRNLLSGAISTAATAVIVMGTNNDPAFAATTKDTELNSYLYKIVRVREATQQEQRLIKTGKFKDIQRANVKLAIKFMVQNYRLADSIVGASTYLKGGNTQQMKAIDVGQTAVQNLQTILEYFDTSDVENIKLGTSSGMSNEKKELVLKGLEAAQIKLDEFLNFFDDSIVQQVKTKIQEENDLNIKEFDKSLGDIINLPPPT